MLSEYKVLVGKKANGWTSDQSTLFPIDMITRHTNIDLMELPDALSHCLEKRYPEKILPSGFIPCNLLNALYITVFILQNTLKKKKINKKTGILVCPKLFTFVCGSVERNIYYL